MKVVIFSAHHAGHFNPNVEMTRIIVKRGIEVHFFTTEVFKALVEQVGAIYHNYGKQNWTITEAACNQTVAFGCELVPELTDGKLPHQGLPATVNILPYILEQLKIIQPTFCISDSGYPWGFLACEILRIPMVASCSSYLFDDKQRDIVFGMVRGVASVQKSVEWLKSTYNIEYDCIKSYCNYTGFTIVWSTPEFCGIDPNNSQQDERVHFFGPSMSVSTVNTITPSSPHLLQDKGDHHHTPVNSDDFHNTIISTEDQELYMKINQLKKEITIPTFVIFVSSGSVIGTDKWSPDPTPYYLELFQAYGPNTVICVQKLKDEYIECKLIVILVVGNIYDTMKIQSFLPSNFILQTWVNQKALMQVADLFISHCGMNSINEALFHGCPLIGTPIFGDQHRNAAQACTLGCAEVLSSTHAPKYHPGFEHLHSTALSNTLIKISQNYYQYKANMVKVSHTMRERLTYLHQNAVDDILILVETEKKRLST